MGIFAKGLGKERKDLQSMSYLHWRKLNYSKATQRILVFLKLLKVPSIGNTRVLVNTAALHLDI